MFLFRSVLDKVGCVYRSRCANSCRRAPLAHLPPDPTPQPPNRQMAFFRDKSSTFSSAVALHLRLEYYSPGDVVMRQGESGDTMWFAVEGELEARLYHRGSAITGAASDRLRQPVEAGSGEAAAARRDAFGSVRSSCSGSGSGSGSQQLGAISRPYETLGAIREGEHFGEFALLLGPSQRRTATVVALTPCELYSLNRHSLEVLLGRYPQLVKDFESLLKVGSVGWSSPIVCSCTAAAAFPAAKSCQTHCFIHRASELIITSLLAGPASRGGQVDGGARRGAAVWSRQLDAQCREGVGGTHGIDQR
jgi:CRP-like cAMP-binding protein